VNDDWILLDTETTGLTPPIFVVDLAAQRMRGWSSDGAAFQRLLNHNRDIPVAASRVNGYTREILERDGDPPMEVHGSFRDYVQDLPVASYNLAYDLDEALAPELRRLGFPPLAKRGFCVLRLAQRLLDPVPAGNCKLQTLRQYYTLNGGDAHAALGDVQTAASLLRDVLRPLAEQRGLDTLEKLRRFTEQEWFPSRLPFGKHKGRSFRDAFRDRDLRLWLEWLAQSTNARSARMGRWYLQQLSVRGACAEEHDTFVSLSDPTPEGGVRTLTIYRHPELEQVRAMVAGARLRLAELEAAYTSERSKVDAVRVELFRMLGGMYHERDTLRIELDYRRKRLELLLQGREAETQSLKDGFEQAQAHDERNYEQTRQEALDKRPMTPKDEAELARLWRQLVKLYHPDRFAEDPAKRETYEKLTSAINHAKDIGDVATLRAIAEDPHGFILRQGWQCLDFSDEAELVHLRRLLETLQIQILAAIGSLAELRESPDYELTQLVARDASALAGLARKQAELLQADLDSLKEQLAGLQRGLEELEALEQ
jgi:DNA polymerase-3 subunit epsilon